MTHKLFVGASIVSVLMLVAFALASWSTLSELRTQGASAEQNVSTAIQKVEVVSERTRTIESKSVDLDVKIKELAAKSDKQLQHELVQLRKDLDARTTDLLATNNKMEMLENSLNARTKELLATNKKMETLESSLNARTNELMATSKKVEILEKQVTPISKRDFDSFATRKEVDKLENALRAHTAELTATSKKVEMLENQVSTISKRTFDSFATRKEVEILVNELKKIDERTSLLTVEVLKDGQKITRLRFPGGYVVIDSRGCHFYNTRGEFRGNIMIPPPMK
jgi:predicted  nucleic acid-binding Zn-ribbon protein